MSTQPTPEWQPIATAPKDGTVFEAIYQDGTTDEICWALERVHPGGSSREAACGEGWATMNEGCRYAPVDEPTYWRPLYEWHNPSNLTGEEVGVKDGWRLCLKIETEHEGCEWFSCENRKWRGICIYEGNHLSPIFTYRTRRPLPDSSTEPKEGGETCPAPQPQNLLGSNAAAGTFNPDQQAASVQLPWLEQQQRDREALAAETDQAPPQEPTAPAVAEQEPQLFRKKPVVIEAIKWTGWNAEEMRAFGVPPTTAQYQQRGRMLIPTLEGEMTAQVGDWIIKGVKGEFYPCKPDIFVSTYEPAAPVAVGETPETDALEKETMAGRETHWLQVFATYQKLLKFARNLERQRDAARRERDEARKIVRETSWMARRYADGRMTHAANTFNTAIEPAYSAGWLSPMLSNEAYARDGNFSGEWLSIEKQRDALATERDRLREENADAVKHNTENWVTINKQIEELHHLKSALATAQADIAKLCSVIAAAFAETAKPLNASVEYDARPTEWERLKKVQEILSSAIDAADHGARDYQAAQAEAAADKRRLDWLESTVRGTGASRFYRSAFITLGDGLNILVDVKTHGIFEGDSIRAALDAASTDQITEPSMVPMPSQFGTHPHDMAVGPCACGATHKLTDWPKAVRDALDAASATEAKRIPVKVRMAKDLGPDLWAIMAPNTPRFWVKKGDEVPVKCNQHGAMTLLTPHGELGVKPQECEIIEWTEGGQP